MKTYQTLAQLKKGQQATIQQVVGHPTLTARLQELGFIPGSVVRLLAQGAFGGAMAFQLRGSTIALRRTDASCIEVAA